MLWDTERAVKPAPDATRILRRAVAAREKREADNREEAAGV